MHVHGHDDIAAQFAALPSLFKAVAITATGPPRVEYGPGPDGGARPATARTRAAAPAHPPPPPSAITIPNTQTYTLRGPLPLSTTLEVETTLWVDPASRRVTAHHDGWKAVRVRALGGERRVPLLAAPRPVRAVSGSLTSRLLRLGGWGKVGGGERAPAGAVATGGGGSPRVHQD